MATRILIIDDDADTCEALQELARIWGYDADVAGDGCDGIMMALERRPDVVLLDLGLPDMDGHDVARRIRAGCDRDAPLLVALTGTNDDGRSDAGFDAYVVKPADPDALRLLVERRSPAARIDKA